jgi:hypothetical protein
VLEQIEALENHAARQPLAGNLRVGQLIELVADAAVADELAIDPDGPGIDPLQLVDAAKKRALAGSRGPDNAEHPADGNLDRHAVERLNGPE